LFLASHLIKCAFQIRSGGTRGEVFALSLSFTVSNFRAISLAWFLSLALRNFRQNKRFFVAVV
ncbi:hypothetical protein ACTR5F_004598, partial [Vibrio parahaemolyticus]